MEVWIKSSSGRKKVPIHVAEITLNFKKQNPTQDWELDDKGFIYDGETIKKAPKKKEKDLPGEDESKQEL